MNKIKDKILKWILKGLDKNNDGVIEVRITYDITKNKITKDIK